MYDPRKGLLTPVAQLDRATDFGSVGSRFESWQACFYLFKKGVYPLPCVFNRGVNEYSQR